jgi:hypothetical protein
MITLVALATILPGTAARLAGTYTLVQLAATALPLALPR